MTANPFYAAGPPKDRGLRNQDVTESLRCENLYVCNSVVARELVVERLEAGGIPILDLPEDLLNLLVGPGISTVDTVIGSVLSRTVQSGIECGTGTGSLVYDGIGSGINPTPSGDDVVVLGFEATALGNNSIAVGRNAAANAANTIAVGHNATASGIDGIAFGANSSIGTGTRNMAIGDSASIGSGSNSIMIGVDGSITGSDNVVVGHNSSCSGNRCTLIGDSNSCAVDDAIAIGNNLIPRSNRQVLFGHNASGDLSADGRVHFFGREPAQVGGPLPAASDASLHWNWNNVLYRIPVFTSVPP